MSNRTDRPTATYPTATSPTGYPLPEGWRVDPRPGRYLDPADPRLVRSDATPTGAFPTRRSIRPLVSSQQAAARAARSEQGTDAATTARTRPGTRACHTSAAPSTEQAAPAETLRQDFNILDAGRPGILRRPSLRWHPSLVQLFVGAVIAIIAFTGIARSATRGMADASARCHQLMATDWSAAERECGARYPGTEPAPAAQAAQPPQAVPADTDTADIAPTSKPAWTVHGTDSPYDRTDPAASPLDLPRCTTSPDTPLPCLATISPDSSRAVVLEEDASLTALVRR